MQYKAGDERISIPASELTEHRLKKIVEMIQIIGGPNPPQKVPTRQECKRCNIGSDRYRKPTVSRIHALVRSHGWRIHPHFIEALMGFPTNRALIGINPGPACVGAGTVRRLDARGAPRARRLHDRPVDAVQREGLTAWPYFTGTSGRKSRVGLPRPWSALKAEAFQARSRSA